MLIQGSGMRRRRTGMRRRRTHRQRGRGFFDTIKSLGSKALNLARSVPIISTGLSLAGKDDWAKGAKSIGLGRRRKRHYGGRMSIYGGRKRRSTKRRFSVFGGRRRRRYRKRGGRKRRYKRRHHKMRGGLLSSIVRGLLGGRRKRHYRKRRGGRRRTYRVGLFSRRRR